MNTIKVKPWGEGQGDYVLINKEDFNPDFHQRFEAADTEAPKPRARKTKPEATEAE